MTKNNRALGLFMGLEVKFMDLSKINSPSFWMVVGDYPFNATPSHGMITSFKSQDDAWVAFEEQSQYHKSFDWLMPVVDKIESKGFSFETTHIGDQYGVKVFSKDMKMLKYTAMSTVSRHEAIYEAVILTITSEAKERLEKIKKDEEQKKRNDEEAERERQRKRKQDEDATMLAIIASSGIAACI